MLSLKLGGIVSEMSEVALLLFIYIFILNKRLLALGGTQILPLYTRLTGISIYYTP